MMHYMMCTWRPTDQLQYFKYTDPTDRVINACALHLGCTFHIARRGASTIELLPYTRSLLINIVESRRYDPNIVIGVQTAHNPTIVISLAIGPVGCLMNNISVTFHGDMCHLFAMQPMMLLAADEFNADYGRVLDHEVLSSFANNRTKASGGELAYIRRSEMVEVEGFTAQRHGDGVLYVMDRDLAESGVEARAAAILRLQPLYDALP